MATTSLAHTAHETIREYVLRGHGIFELHRDEILAGYQGGGKWIIPSGSESGKVYETHPGTRSKSSHCECVGFQHHGHCSHAPMPKLPAWLPARVLCDSCGERHWYSDLREVHEEDGLLSWFAGDRLCRECVEEGRWT